MTDDASKRSLFVQKSVTSMTSSKSKGSKEVVESVVIPDASSLIGLAAAGQFHLLRPIFERIIVTTAVRDEVMAGGNAPGAAELDHAIDEGLVDVMTTKPRDEFSDLGRGEASVLTLAVEYGDRALVLIDETQGRRRANDLGIPFMGLVGVLLEAKESGLIETVRPSLECMQSAGFRLSKQLVLDTLEAAGETGGFA